MLKQDPDLIVVWQEFKVISASGMIALEFIQQLLQGVIVELGCPLKCTQIANIITSRHVNDNAAPEWNHDYFDEYLKDDTRTENTSEKSYGADQTTLLNSFSGMGAQFDETPTTYMNSASTPPNPHYHGMPELDHISGEDQTGQRFQTPGRFTHSSRGDHLTPITPASTHLLLGQDNPRHYFSFATPNTSIGQSHSLVSTPITRTTPTSLLNTDLESSLPGHTTSAATTGSLDGSGVCPTCGSKVSAAKTAEYRNKNVNRHMREKHKQKRVECPECPQSFPRRHNMTRHVNEVHKRRSED